MDAGLSDRLFERTSATFATMVTYIIPVNGLMLGALVLILLGVSLVRT